MFSSDTTQVSDGGYQISRSLRFNSADSAYLNRTFASNPNRKTMTFSVWVKRSALSGIRNLFTSRGSPTVTRGEISFESDQLTVGDNNGSAWVIDLYSTPVFRDPSAWYHVVVAIDTTQTTSTDRVKVYVNNVIQTMTGTYPSQNLDTDFLISTATSYIGTVDATVRFFDGYMTEVNVIDGQALTPSSFGETNAQTGVWQPKAYSGSYGTNGFYLNFSDNSNTTAATLGKDYSGNGNNWTPNNFSVTAGAGNDSLVDSPTSYGTDTGAGGEVRGNYATLNPLKKKSAATISNGNLALVATSAVYVTGLSTISPSSGTYYMEMLCSGSNSNRPWAIGVVNADASADASLSSTGTYFVTNNSGSTVNYYLGGSATALSTSSTWAVGDIISLAWNVDSGKFWVGRNGVWYPSSTGGTVASNSDVAAGNYPTFTISYSGNTNPQVIPAFVTYDTTASIDANFGQRPFAYTAPSGYKALCTQNLPTPTIGATTATLANKYYDANLWTGNSSTQSITNSGSFQPDMVWIKARSTGTYNHQLFDAVRGTNKAIYPNLTNAEFTDTDALTAFNSNGFTMGAEAGINNSGDTYVGWQWKANGSGSTNTAGSITSTVSANTTSGFSVVTYTGNGTVGATRGHGLGVAPSMIFVKGRAGTYGADNWHVYHSSLGNTGGLFLNLTNAFTVSSYFWNDTSPSSTVFTTSNGSSNNASGTTYVAYCFAEVAGYSKFGSYTGNGSADGPFVFTGFRPAYLLVKRSDAAYDWWVFDSKRLGYNVTSARLSPDLSDAEYTTGSIVDFTSNGFKIRDASQGWNGSGGTIIYMAFAEAPLKFSLAR